MSFVSNNFPAEQLVLAERHPDWHIATEHTDWLSCPLVELDAARASAPDRYLRGMLDGVRLARMAMAPLLALQAMH